MLPSSRRLLYGWLLSLLLCLPTLTIAQTELINSNVVVVGTTNLCIVTVGATDAYACNLGRTITAYQPWTRYAFIPNVPNTGPAALALNGLASLPIKKLVAGAKTDLVTGDIATNQPVEVYYDGTEFVWATTPGGGGTATTVAYRRTARSATATLDTTDGPVVECTAAADVTLTLPSTAGTQTWLHIVKADSGVGRCIIQPTSGQNMNGVVNGQLFLSQQWEAVDVYVSNTTTPNWHGLSSVTNMRRSIYIPAASMDVSGACTLGASTTLVTNGPKLPTITCTASNTDAIEFDVSMPDGWDAGPITLQLAGFYLNTTHTGQTFDMNFSGKCHSGGDVVTAYAITSGATAESGANVEAILTASGVANRMLRTTTLPLTLAAPCAAGNHVFIHGLVDAAGTSAALVPDFRIVGVKIEYIRSVHD